MPLYKEEYVNRMNKLNTPIKDDYGIIYKKEKTDSNNNDFSGFTRKVLTEFKTFGVMYFLYNIANKIGLFDILKQSIPEFWKEIFTLACYLVTSDKPVMYCDDWLELNPAFSVGKLE
jgi:hypothetical protein